MDLWTFLHGFMLLWILIACDMFSGEECSSDKPKALLLHFQTPGFYEHYGRDIVKDLLENLGPQQVFADGAFSQRDASSSTFVHFYSCYLGAVVLWSLRPGSWKPGFDFSGLFSFQAPEESLGREEQISFKSGGHRINPWRNAGGTSCF